MRKPIKLIVYTAVAAMFLLSGSALAFQGGSIAKGSFSVYKGGSLVEKLTGQNPIDKETLLVCDSKCMIKSSGIVLTPKDGTKLAIKNQKDTFIICYREGLVNFVITNNARKIVFYTPEGSYTVADVIFQASSQSSVRGYITVNEEGKTEIGVHEGRMIFSTASGTQTVDANHKFVLDKSNVPPKEDDDDKTGAWAGGPCGTQNLLGGTFSTQNLLIGSGAVTGIIGAIYLIDQASDDDDVKQNTLSPSN